MKLLSLMHPKLQPSAKASVRSTLLIGIVAIALGGLMGLTAAPSALWWLAWVGLSPLWFWVRASSLRQAALIGGCWGLGYYGTVLSWLLGLHPLTWLGLSWTASLAIAMSCWLLATLWCCGIPLLWAVCLRSASPWLSVRTRLLGGTTLWCVLEKLWAQSPLWWPDIANSQSPHNLAIAHLGQLSGLTTVTAVLVLVNGLVAEALLTRQRKFVGLAVLLGLLFHGLGWGLMQSGFAQLLVSRMPEGFTPAIASPTAPLSIGIVQGNIPTRRKLSATGVQESVAVYRKAYQDLAAQGVDAVLLPEGALPFFWGRSPIYDEAILSAVNAAQVPLWTGTFVPTQQSYTQSLISVTSPARSGQYGSRYSKVKLVPLGEYLPFSNLLSAVVRKLSPIQMGMAPGEGQQKFEQRFERKFEQRFETFLAQATVAICYESAFPELLRQQTAAGGQFILSIANNDPFNDRMLAQHHALDVLRAVESDRWLVRATNTGLSAAIDPHGRTQWKSRARTRTLHRAQIQRLDSQTFYVRYGNWLLPVLVVSSLGLSLADRYSPQKRA
jgi:apolipoprotein N-acyltransferase